METNNFKSQREHALKLAIDTMNRLVSSDCKASVTLRGCFAIASLIGDYKNKEWINKELSGYNKEDKEIPYQRKFIGPYKNKFGHFSNDREGFTVIDPVHKIEHTLECKKVLKVIDTDFNKVHELEQEWCYNLLSSVKDRCLKFLIDTITQIQYSGTVNSLIENIQKEVDTKITKINPEINSEIQSISNNVHSEDPVELSKAAHSCRRILKLLADEVLPAQDEPYLDNEGNSHELKDNNYMNRLLTFIDKNQSDKLIKSEIKYLASYFDNLIELAGKGEHSKISKFETEQTAIHTYLIISEVLRVMNKK